MKSKIVEALIGNPRKQPLPVKIRTAGGDVVDAEFSGYYEWPGKGHVPSIGYRTPQGLTHGILRDGDEILSCPKPSRVGKLESYGGLISYYLRLRRCF